MPLQDLVLNSLSGGMNDTDSPNELPEDQCVLAENVEFFGSALGERRNGCGALSISGSGLTGTTIVHLSQWFPDNDVLDPEFIAISSTPGTSAVVSARTAGTWADITPTDALNTTIANIYDIVTVSVNDKLFMAYRSAQDRLHVRDAVSGLRRTGMATPGAAPTGANTGAGSYATIRYFRVRFTEKSGSTVIRRSEFSAVLSFTPSGSGTGVIITKPATVTEGETHWELEASTDNALFYRIADTAVGTTTVTDSTAFATGYSSNPLSHSSGAYGLQPSARYLAADGDRLLGAGHWTDATKQSQVWWSAVFNDPGVGNDERLPTVTTGGAAITTNTNIDNYENGPITGMIAGEYGTVYVFKWSAIYKLVRTGDNTRAYEAITITKRVGAIKGSIVRGVTEYGANAIYFVDPLIGPCRLSPNGPQQITGLRSTWGRVNTQATNLVARGCYYPYKQQVHWWVAVDGENQPGLKLVLQVSELRQGEDNTVGRGWSLATGRIAQARAVAVFTEVVSIDGVVSLSERPFIGLTTPDYIQRCDVEETDAGAPYVAVLRTRPYIVAGLLNRWGAMTAALLATANSSANLVIKFIRDFGLETNQITTDLKPAGSETLVVKTFNDLRMSNATIVQIEFTDP